jgi:hypothetical protein
VGRQLDFRTASGRAICIGPVGEAYRVIAPRRLVAELDAGEREDGP